MNIIYAIIIGYILGSIPWALLIGKTFYKIDIREYGSGNLGGTNAGRILGKKVGLLVIFLDAFKSLLVVLISLFIFNDINAAIVGGLLACIGHCFPVFANFKGGKGVSTALGYNIGISIFVINEFLLCTLLPAFVFILILSLTKMVSLSSIIWITIITITYLFVDSNFIVTISFITLAILIIYRHLPNIGRIIRNKEKKITWIK